MALVQLHIKNLIVAFVQNECIADLFRPGLVESGESFHYNIPQGNCSFSFIVCTIENGTDAAGGMSGSVRRQDTGQTRRADYGEKGGQFRN